MDHLSQTRRLLANASRKDFSASYDFYDRMMRQIDENIWMVDYRNFGTVKKYICEMNEVEYFDYLNYLEELQMSGLNKHDFFYSKV